MQTNILGYPRIGSRRELKKACESFWAGNITEEELLKVGAAIRQQNWTLQKESGIDLVPSNDFSFYDQVLDTTLTVGAIPARYASLQNDRMALYFAMARGYQREGKDITAMEMTKWFDTNYHYIVPEFARSQNFFLFYNKALEEYREGKAQGIETKPVLLGPVSYLLSGKEKEAGFHRLELLERLLPVYIELLKELEEAGAVWVQLDEPFLVTDIDEKTKKAYTEAYDAIRKACPRLKLLIATYFEGLRENMPLAVQLPVDALHIDLVRAPSQLDDVLAQLPADKVLSLGVVDGRNIWKNNFDQSLEFINKAVPRMGTGRVMIAGSSSFLHVPYDLDLETDEEALTPEIKQWMAFARQKVEELALLKKLAEGDRSLLSKLDENRQAMENKRTSPLIHNKEVEERCAAVSDNDARRKSPFPVRKKLQQQELQLPSYPTTTIGSFPQTKEVRSWRAKFKKGELSAEEYDRLLKSETKKTIEWQERIGLDVLVHGEFERNDMVEYFGEQLDGFAFTRFGWVQSYGSRCVKPPVIYGDVSRPHPMTLYWANYAQSLTTKPVKGMLTGPVTILQWSFVRNDQERSKTCLQIALSIRDEVCDLEQAGIRVIQIDEPAIREGLPIRRNDWKSYLDWAVRSFCIASTGVEDKTQIHTHMCYSEFNDIIEHIALMDADVITIECSRSQMELLDAFVRFSYPNDIGPGVYDIHSPRVPTVDEIVDLLKEAARVIPQEQLWVNPDCGLKTRGWKETEESLIRMVKAARLMREQLA
ncbi:MAG: 5-methyltetrahydropteroyltriglutamate--homocysteine S-methyltransferase [Proteiniphilum sp.]|jgi:5-methyltetrahydropteroyltriglutamate--homocysteine methyltransferase|uniref:5-methyltetrahydropteroyltriglutamate-- homocysteine S-methyltransferase n=1 Tax=Proteiniphilum sp. TaxID=1926877 RepID=UPI002B1F0C18|nr:5-methyltetrahydropteroyltriglutamate--homocysteine S-methyltransferase [Proteiniphilum sp.]MEA5129806.1 5-methyltetrahydropteroyltriglutamate--homocysteine S-methyltransferase [Proteiniphilum sp.]